MPSLGPMPDPGNRAVLWALDEWRKNVVDPKTNGADLESRDRIRAYVAEGLGWPADAEKYTHDGPGAFQWCGAFASWCYRDSLRADVRKTFFASTYRLHRWSKGLDVNGKKPPVTAEPRSVLSDDSRAGDILIVGHVKDYGDHVCLVERYDPQHKLFHTIEGNASGPSPTGVRREGVVRRTRALADMAALYRPAAIDFVAT